MARYSSPDGFKAVTALSVYINWKSNCKDNDELMKDSLLKALDAIGYQEPLPEGITHIIQLANICIHTIVHENLIINY